MEGLFSYYVVMAYSAFFAVTFLFFSFVAIKLIVVSKKVFIKNVSQK